MAAAAPTPPSTNTPLLLEILSQLKDVKSDIASIRTYIHNESKIQEKTTTYQIRDILNKRYGHATHTSVGTLRDVYLPDSNQTFTDIDGCLLTQSRVGPVIIKNNNGRNINVTSNDERTYFIEAKHGLTKSIIDGKLLQFCKLLDLFQKLHNGTLRAPSTPVTRFDEMVHNHGLVSYPKRIIFIFASDSIDAEHEAYIHSINAGTLTEELYNSVLVSLFKNHKTYDEILEDRDIGRLIKAELRDALTFDALRAALTLAAVPTTRRQGALEKQKQALLEKYAERISALLVPYSAMTACFSMLKGHLATYSHGKLGGAAADEFDDMVGGGRRPKPATTLTL